MKKILIKIPLKENVILEVRSLITKDIPYNFRVAGLPTVIKKQLTL